METAEWICSTWKDAKEVTEWWAIIDILYGALQASNEWTSLEAYEVYMDYELLLNIAHQHLLDAQAVERRSPELQR
jgi:hypothetical protein